ncbi:DUF4365 domain-containing protein [Nonomuraea sp. AD125B]|uniref:DUF4365 domain-containing protein n=1 Tax=Nonomuraea sp. AD125B TaxID=3242897 RepID=UPI003528A1B9
MPPKRPQSHKVADIALGCVVEVFRSQNWIVEEMNRDYGEDLHVRIVKGEVVTPYVFYVQVKGTGSLSRYRTKDGKCIKYPFEGWRLRYWADFWEPVVVAVWDSLTREIYWEIAQDAEDPEGATRRSHLLIPLDNKLDAQGLARIKNRTLKRHRRFENEKAGASVLVERLEELLGVSISYDPQGGILIVGDPDGGATMTVFGKYAEWLERRASELGITPDDLVNDALSVGLPVIESLLDGKELVITDSQGRVEQRWNSVDEFFRYIDRREEVQGFDD